MLALTAQAIPVIVRSMPPSHVDNWPQADELQWWTFYIALVTLIGVGFQILLARRDLQNNERQFKELMRRPDLRLAIDCAPAFLNIDRDKTVLPLHLEFEVTNWGTKSAHEIMVQVLIPATCIVLQPLDRPFPIFIEGNVRYHQFDIAAPVDCVLRTNGCSVVLELFINLARNVTSLTIRYRIHDEYDIYPLDSSLGEVNSSAGDIEMIVHGAVIRRESPVFGPARKLAPAIQRKSDNP